MSSGYPMSCNSLPELQFNRMLNRSFCKLTKAFDANWASGDNFPDKQLIIAPAPSRSSIDGRRLPSSCHLSPAGITAILLPNFMAALATVLALRKQPARVGVSLADRERAAPLGEGRTRRVPAIKNTYPRYGDQRFLRQLKMQRQLKSHPASGRDTQRHLCRPPQIQRW